MIRIGDRSMRLAAVALVVVAVASCGGGETAGGNSDGGLASQEGERTGANWEERGSGGDASASFTVGGDRWEFANFVCIAGPASLDFAASQGMIGVSTEPTVVIKLLGDWEGSGDGEIQTIDAGMFEGALTNPDTSWSSTLDTGGVSFTIDGSRVTVEGLFDDGLTPGTTEAVEGVFEGDCGEAIEAPPATTTTLPDFTESGSVTVGGETFVFTFDPPGRCGGDGNDGRVSSTGVLVDDPTRQVVFSYATAEMSSTGEPALQLIIYGPEGDQMWYSAVGYFGDGVGSIETMTGDATSVSVTGTLQRSGTEEFAPFSAEATCDQ